MSYLVLAALAFAFGHYVSRANANLIRQAARFEMIGAIAGIEISGKCGHCGEHFDFEPWSVKDATALAGHYYDHHGIVS